MKNLVYFCVFYNKDYFKLLNLLLTSLKFFSSTDNFDLLILTNENMVDLVKELQTKLKLSIFIKTFNFTTIFQSACARLFIFDYEMITIYDKILYIDTDIIIKKDLAKIFDLQIDDKLYGIESGTINSPSFGNQFFDFDKIDRSIKGINSGTLLFNNKLCIRDLFCRIIGHINVFTDSKMKIPYCMDQPFINYHAISSEMYNNTLLNDYVSLYEDNEIVTNYETSIICHFSFPIGNFGHKFERMRKFMNEILKEEIRTDVDNFNGKKYKWNTGFIEFDNGMVIKTSWGNGNYRILNNDKVMVSWNNFDHVLKFNEDYKEFISVRMNDFEVVFGMMV